MLLVTADPATLERKFDDLRRSLWPKFYVPQIRQQQGEYLVEIVRRPARTTWGFWVNLGLLCATVVSASFAGAFLWMSYVGVATLSVGDFVNGGLYFAAPLLAILGLHELAHYLVARHHHVEASLPYFLPVPPPYLIFGTFGAFISLREPIPSRKILFDIGAAGPLAGFAVAIPVTVAGMFLSLHAPVLPLTNCGPTILGVNYGDLLIGLPAVYYFLALFVPHAAQIVSLHPLALAGWVGLLVTSINLLPAGQLDGGHVFAALFGTRARFVSYAAVVFLALVGILTLYLGWLLFAALIILLGVRHPPPLDDVSRLGTRRQLLGALVAVVLVVGFVLVPISTPSDSFGLAQPTWTAVPGSPQAVAAEIDLTVENHDTVTHGYVVSANVTQVIAQVDENGTNRTVPLNGSLLAAYLANSSWSVALPNGTTYSFTGVGSWSIPAGDYLALNASGTAGARGTVLVTYENPGSASVTIELAVHQLCDESGAAPPTPQSVTVY